MIFRTKCYSTMSVSFAYQINWFKLDVTCYYFLFIRIDCSHYDSVNLFARIFAYILLYPPTRISHLDSQKHIFIYHIGHITSPPFLRIFSPTRITSLGISHSIGGIASHISSKRIEHALLRSRSVLS